MSSQVVLVLPKVAAPQLAEAFLAQERWQNVPSIPLVRVEDGDLAALPTDVRIAWSERGVHILFRCTDPLPYSVGRAGEIEGEEDEVVGVFLDPSGERNQYMAVLVNPCGRALDARVENPLHHALASEIDLTWDCPGLRVRSWSRHNEWGVEILIPFDGITPAIKPPRIGTRWVGNFYRIERLPVMEITAWQPSFTSPPDLHASSCFGILEFGGMAS